MAGRWHCVRFGDGTAGGQCHGAVRLGGHGEARHGVAGRGGAWRSRRGDARPGMARRGSAWPGVAVKPRGDVRSVSPFFLTAVMLAISRLS
jgi:hypothetical protein